MNTIQKAHATKRLSALIFDLIMLAILTVGFGELISVITGYDKHYDAWSEGYQKYEAEYNISFDITESEYLALTQEQKDVYEAAQLALSKDKELIKEYNTYMNLTLVILSLGILLAVLVWEFIIPLKIGNGMTLGKKIFAIGLMRTDQVKISPILLFIRAILGKYTIEIMVPTLLLLMMVFNYIGIMAIIIIIMLFIAQLICIIATRTNSAIHDILAGTVVIDYPSQMIYDTYDEMIKAKADAAAKAAAEQTY